MAGKVTWGPVQGLRDRIPSSALYFSVRVRSLGKENRSTLDVGILPTCVETYQKVTWNSFNGSILLQPRTRVPGTRTSESGIRVAGGVR